MSTDGNDEGIARTPFSRIYSANFGENGTNLRPVMPEFLSPQGTSSAVSGLNGGGTLPLGHCLIQYLERGDGRQFISQPR